MAYSIPMHMRRNVVASVENHPYSDLQEAFDNAADGTVVLLCDLTVTDSLTINNAHTTLDLDGHCLMFTNGFMRKDSVRKSAALTVTAPGSVICNGAIVCSSGVSEAILVQTPPVYVDEYEASVLLREATLETTRAQCGICVRAGGVYLQKSSISSTGPGIYMRNVASRLGVTKSFIRAGRCGLIMGSGRLTLVDSLVSSGASCAVHITGGDMVALNTTIRAHNGCALVAAYNLRSPEPPAIDIRADCEICSYAAYAMDLKAGNVRVVNARIRATQGTAIRMDAELGIEQDDYAAQLELRDRTHVISWKGDGILHRLGTLIVGDTVFECDRGKDVVDEEEHAKLGSFHEESDATEERQQEKTRENEKLQLEELHPIERVDISKVHTSLHLNRPIKFSGTLDPSRESSSYVEIVFEQWTNGADIITSYDPLPPQENSTYRYIIALKAKEGYAFARRFALYYRGQRIRYTAMISRDLKRAMISWDLTATATNSRWPLVPMPR